MLAIKTRHQKGYIYKKGGWGYVRHYDFRTKKDGTTGRVQIAHRVAPVCDQNRSKKSVAPLIEKMLARVNNDRHTPEATMPLGRFVERVHPPHAEAQKRPSTFRGYKNLWQTHVKARWGNARLLDFRTCDAERLLAEIARRNDMLTHSTLKRIKSLMSGLFEEARRQGYLDGVNPMQDVSIPLAREGAETCAYSLEEIMQMLAVLPEPAATMVAGAAFTGVRRGELRGVRWEDYNGSELLVT